MKKKREPKENKKFWKHYRIFLIISFIIIIFIWALLWTFLVFYEKSRPEYEIEKISKLFQKGKTEKLLEYIEIEGKYNTKDSSQNIMKDDLKKAKISYEKKRGEYKDKTPVYSILDNDKEIAVVKLKSSSKKDMFNTVKWGVEYIDYYFNKEDIKIIALPDEKITINGIELSKDDATDENYHLEKLKNVLQYVDFSPLVMYEITDVYKNSVIDYEKSSFQKEGNVYSLTYPSDEKLLEEYKEFLIKWCKNYTKYVVNEETFGSISGAVVQNSNAYNFLRTVANTNIWLAAHTPTEFSDFTFENMQKYQNDLYSVDIKYSYSFYVNDDLKEYQTILTLYLIEINDYWYIADLTT